MLIHVLLADDHPVLREGVRVMLARHDDIDVVGEAADGEEAVALTVLLKPDVAIIDLHMPRLNGFEVTRCIHRRMPSTAVLILATFGDQFYVEAALEAGASGYMLKTCRPAELLDAVRRVHQGGTAVDAAIARPAVERPWD